MNQNDWSLEFVEPFSQVERTNIFTSEVEICRSPIVRAMTDEHDPERDGRIRLHRGDRFLELFPLLFVFGADVDHFRHPFLTGFFPKFGTGGKIFGVSLFTGSALNDDQFCIDFSFVWAGFRWRCLYLYFYFYFRWCNRCCFPFVLGGTGEGGSDRHSRQQRERIRAL